MNKLKLLYKNLNNCIKNINGKDTGNCKALPCNFQNINNYKNEIFNTVDNNGNTILHYLCHKNDIKLLNFLYKNNIINKAILNKKNIINGNTCLHISVEKYGQTCTNIIDYLIKIGADHTIKNNNGIYVKCNNHNINGGSYLNFLEYGFFYKNKNNENINNFENIKYINDIFSKNKSNNVKFNQLENRDILLKPDTNIINKIMKTLNMNESNAKNFWNNIFISFLKSNRKIKNEDVYLLVSTLLGGVDGEKIMHYIIDHNT